MIHTLENDQLRVKIADHGAELSEIYDKQTTIRYSGMLIRPTGNAMLRCFSRMLDAIMKITV